MPFVPARMMTYSVNELIDFIKDGSVTLKNIAMLKKLDLFSADELMMFIGSGVCTFEDMQRCGLNFRKQEELRERLQLWEIENSFWKNACAKNTAASYREYQAAFPNGLMYNEASSRISELDETEVWNTARQSHTISLYEHYLSLYPNGIYKVEAESYIRELMEKMSSMKRDLLADMRYNPMKYAPNMMQRLFKGMSNSDPSSVDNLESDDILARYITMGCTISYQELVDEGIIPPTITEKELMTPEFHVPQTKNFNDFPLDRTDIYFLGVPRSGKSSVLAGLFNAMTTRGNWRYVPNINEEGVDNSISYFNGLVRSVATKKPPVPTARDTINYINIDVPNAVGTKRTAHLNFVEISGECFRNLADSLGESRDVWKTLGASQVIANQNRKVLFFLLDYNTILGNQYGVTSYDQQEALNNALIILSNDGPNRKNPTKGCTMSKVESVGVIMTKADLMPADTKEERLEIAMNYLSENFSAFMTRLGDVCRDFSINRKENYKPYIFTFSLGDFFIGNTLIYNHNNSMELASYIEQLVPTQRSWSIF